MTLFFIVTYILESLTINWFDSNLVENRLNENLIILGCSLVFDTATRYAVSFLIDIIS